jgi:TRAP-type mannitol/chloroaromatic compound transport system permease small subunit
MYNFARLFIFLGLTFLVIGGVAYVLTRVGLPLGHLPGDIRIQSQNVTCIIPIVSMILISIVLTVIVNVVIRLLNK